MSDVKDLISPQTIETMVATYQITEVEVREAYEILDKSRQRLFSVFGDKEMYHNFSLVSNEYSSYERTAGKAMKRVREEIWKSIIIRLGIKEFLTVKRAMEIDHMIERDEMGEISIEHIFSIIQQIGASANELAKEAIREAYDFLKEGARTASAYELRRTLKTNIKNGRFDIKDKIILEKVENNSYDRYPHDSWELIYGQGPEKVRVIDKVFHLLDGKPFPTSYRSPLVDALNVAGKNNLQPEVTTAYFYCKGYKNGNLHIKFLRMDLVAKLNAFCADITQLKG